MSISWQSMTLGEFADFERMQGERIRQSYGVLWRQVRPFFYRPLLPFAECSPATVRQLFGHCSFSGFQHAVPEGRTGNSWLNLLLFQDVSNYSVKTLDYNRKRQVKLAAAQFTIRPIADPAEFKNDAYPIYLSFYRRTAYGFRADRQSPQGFGRWAAQLFGSHKALVLGAYREGKLAAVSVSMLVEQTLLYSTFFCDDVSLRLYVSDLMLHVVRESAAACPQVKQIFAGMYKGGKGLDDFYLLRGCKLVRKPAHLHLNPSARFILQRFLPRQYQQMVGDIKVDAGKPGSKKVTPPQKLKGPGLPGKDEVAEGREDTRDRMQFQALAQPH
jgi:hypothetical protein